jgi:RNA polymerase sigma-70 factor (ECF subfamily)
MCEGKQTDSPDPDVARMLAFRDGDEEAFVTLYRQYRDRIYNFTRRLLGDAALAEEATQDAFLKLYAARDRYEARSRFSTYLFRIARNHCLNLRARHDNRRVDRSRTSEHTVGDAAGPDREAERTELRTALRAALAELPENQATALVLAQYEGLSYREIASVLGVSESATKSLIHRARERMMKELRGWTSREGEVSHAV